MQEKQAAHVILRIKHNFDVDQAPFELCFDEDNVVHIEFLLAHADHMSIAAPFDAEILPDAFQSFLRQCLAHAFIEMNGYGCEIFGDQVFRDLFGKSDTIDFVRLRGSDRCEGQGDDDGVS